jgi:hypothetical protein
LRPQIGEDDQLLQFGQGRVCRDANVLEPDRLNISRNLRSDRRVLTPIISPPYHRQHTVKTSTPCPSRSAFSTRSPPNFSPSSLYDSSSYESIITVTVIHSSDSPGNHPHQPYHPFAPSDKESEQPTFGGLALVSSLYPSFQIYHSHLETLHHH